MAIHYRTHGFVLKKIDRGEADRIFTIYTKDFGKLEILGKAIRKIKSKLRGGVELFYLSEIEFIQGKTYKTLTDAILINNFENLRKDLERLAIAYKISEIFDNLVKEEEPDKKIWQFLLETFEKLSNRELKIENWKLKIIYYYFLWNFLSFLGYQPELYNCSLCQKKIVSTEKIYFSPKEGGIVCFNCFKKVKSGQRIEPEIVKILRIILKRDWQTLLKLKMEPQYKKSLKLTSDNYLSYILEQV